MLRKLYRNPRWAVLVSVLVVAGVCLALFQPWKLWFDQTVNEAAPAVAGARPSVAAAGTSMPGPRGVLATGTFISHEHKTTGTLSVLDLGHGRRVLRIEDLDTSNGPDLQVWIADAEVYEGASGWSVFDDAKHVELGPLKGNKGSQNYEIPASLKLADFSSVSIWCARFHISFGAARLIQHT